MKTSTLKHTASLSALLFTALFSLFCAKLSAQEFWRVNEKERRIEVKALYISPSGDQFATVQGGIWSSIWEPGGRDPIRAVGRHRGDVMDVAYSPDGEMFATASWDRTFRLWSTKDGSRLGTAAVQDAAINGITFSKDGKYVATTSWDGRIRIYSTDRLRLQHLFFGVISAAGAIDFHPTQPWLATGTQASGVLTVWDYEKASTVGNIRLTDALVVGLAYSSDGKYIAIGDSKGRYHVYLSEGLSHIYTKEDAFEPGHNMHFRFSGQILKEPGPQHSRFVWRSFWGVPGNEAIIASIPGLSQQLALRSQFETGFEYVYRNMQGMERLAPAAVQRLIEERERILTRVATSRKELTLPATDLRLLNYDVYEGVYHAQIRGEKHTFAINREEARELFEQRQHVRIEAIEQLSEDLERTELLNITLFHPVSGTRYNIGVHQQVEDLPRLATLPARLELTEARFTDSDGDNRLSAGERATLQLTLSNHGEGPAQFVRIVGESEADSAGLSANVGTIEPGTQSSIALTITGGDQLTDGNAEISLSALEINGFHADPFRLVVPTRARLEPELEVVDVGIEDAQGRSIITPGMVVDVTLRVRNTGEGIAEHTRAVVTPGEGVFLAATPNPAQATLDVGTLNAGAFRDVRFQAFANNEATAFPLEVELLAMDGRYRKLHGDLGLALMHQQRSTRELVVAARDLNRAADSAEALLPGIARNIPQAPEQNADAVAVIIGNRSYQAGTPQVAFALNDAQLVRRYVEESLGYRPGNILHLEDATLTNMRVIFGDSGRSRGRLADLVKPGISDVFIYYSGHGAPDPNESKAYLMPIDADPMRLPLTGYPLEILYANLSKLNAKSVTVVVDACFSGATGGGDMLIAAASPIGIRVNDPSAILGEHAAIITASDNNQVASWYPDMRHGLLTYYFLKGLQGAADLNGNGQISLDEMRQWLSNESEGVPYMARRLFSREQHPQVWGNNEKILR